MTEVRLTHLHPLEFRDRLRAMPVAWLPLGTLEWHGRHLPLGYDGLKAEALCIRAAEEIGGIAFPPSYYGDHRGVILEAIAAPGVWGDVTRDHRTESCDELGVAPAGIGANAARDHARKAGSQHVELLERTYWVIRAYGFTRIVCVAGHYPNAIAGKAAAARFHAEQSGCRVICGHEGEFGDGGGDHAGAYETSQLKYLMPELVRIDRLAVDDPIEPTGIGGDHPRNASSAQGQAIVESFLLGCRLRLADVPPPTLLPDPDEDGARGNWDEQLATASADGPTDWARLAPWLWPEA